MKTLLTVNASQKTVSSAGSAWTPPVYTWGEKQTLALRLLEERDGELVEPFYQVEGLVCGIGPVDARAVSGKWALQIGTGAQTSSNTTEALPYDCTAAQLEGAINVKTAVTALYGPATARKADGSWTITFATATAAVPLTIRDNTLFPSSLNVGGAVQIDGAWVHEVRFVQVPCVFTDSAERVLPEAPKITRVRGGGSGVGYSVNEIQALYVSPDFRATYDLQRGFGRTPELRLADTAETVQLALEAAFGTRNFLVTNAGDYTVNIEFRGEFAGAPQDLLTVNALNPPPGDLTLTLDFGKHELLVPLRTAETVTFPFEVRAQIEDADEVVRERVLFTVPITVRKPVTWPQMALVPTQQWLRPPSPVDYVPRSVNTVFTGEKGAAYLVGNGSATVFDVAHPFATEDVVVAVRQNVSNGRQLVDGYDFSVRITNASSVRVTALDTAPATNGWIVLIRALEPIAAFADGLEIAQSQVTDLVERLNALEAAVDSLQDQAAASLPLGVTTTSDPLTIELDSSSEIFPGSTEDGGPITRDALPETGFTLRPAIHDGTVTSWTALPLPTPAAAAGHVYENNSGAAVRVTGGLVKVGEFFGSDGKALYALSRSGTSTSFFARAMERELFSFGVTEQMLRAGSILGLSFDLRLQMLKTNTRTQFVVVIEHGTMPSQTSPATTATNLENIVWSATPMLTQRVIVDRSGTNHRFGVQVLRNALGALSANKDFYNFRTAAESVPASANVAIRARLIRFDTENAVTDARGFVALEFKNASARITY
jgi:hypothetical protein